jgi:hypothetical protein
MPSTGAPPSGFKRRFRIFDRSVLVISADAAGSVEEGVRAVGIDVNLDPRLDEMGPHRTFRDLQLERAVGDAIVMADLPLLLDAQDLVEIDARNGREGRALAGRIDGEAGVVGGQDVADESVGRLDVGDAGEPELPSAAGPEASRTPAPSGLSKGRSGGRPSLDGLWGEKAPIGATPN